MVNPDYKKAFVGSRTGSKNFLYTDSRTRLVCNTNQNVALMTTAYISNPDTSFHYF